MWPIWGERMKQLQVQVDPERMLSARRDAQRGHGGHLGRPGFRAAAVFELRRRRRPSGSSRPPISGCSIQPSLAGHHAGRPGQRADRRSKSGRDACAWATWPNVLWEQPPLIGDAVINDGPGLMLIVEKFPWANTLEVTRGVEAALDEMRPGLPGHRDRHHDLPAGDLHRDVDRQSHDARCSSAPSWWLLVLGAFLFEWRVALISLIAIPLSLVAAGLVLYLRGTTINTMVLAGLRGRPRRRSSTTPSSTSKTSCGGCASIAGQGGDRVDRADHSRGLARGAQRHRLRDADHRAGGAAGLLHGRAVRRLLRAAGARPIRWRCWPPWWWP